MKTLLAVDGSPSSQNATKALIAALANLKETPEIHVVTVHLPVPNIGTAGWAISKEQLDRYYQEESAAALAPAEELLKKAGVRFVEHRVVGDIAHGIVDTATKLGCANIYMGTRGHTAVSNLVLGSVAVKVLHLTKIPVVLAH